MWTNLNEVLDGLSGERNWFAEGAIEGSPLIILSGPEKKHKSWVAIQMAVATISARSWLGVYPIRRFGGIVYLDGEYGEAEFVRRVARVSRGEGQIPETVVAGIRYHYSSGLVCDPRDKTIQAMAEDLRRSPPALIVVDPFRNHLAGSENDAEVVIAAFRGMDMLRSAAECPLLVLHHLNKSGSSSGSRAIASRADLIIEGSDTKVPVYETRGRTLRPTIDLIAEPFSVSVEHENDDDDFTASTLVRAEIKGSELTEFEEDVMALLDAPRSVNWLAEGMGRNKADVRAALRSLEARFMVQCVPAEVKGQKFQGWVRRSEK